MEGKYGLYRQGSSGWTSLRNEEFQEEDVWAVFQERRDSANSISEVGSSFQSSSITPRRLPSAARMIARASSTTAEEPKIVQQSAPVNIPDWSKIYGKKSSESTLSRLDGDGVDDVSAAGGGGVIKGSWDSDDDEDDDGDDSDGTMIPPHEWIARKHARNREVSSFSVCEGAGRTLKGRDLSRVRNTVLTRTGFLE